MFVFVLFYRVCTHVRLGIMETRLFVYVFVVVQDIYTCNYGHFGNDPLCLDSRFCKGYVHI